MTKIHVSILLAVLMLISVPLAAAGTTLTLSRNTTLNDAMLAIETITLATSGKKIYNLVPNNPMIGIPLNNVPWEDAMTIICSMHGLQMEERAGVIMVSVPVAEEVVKFKMDTPQIKISAKVLEVKKNVTENYGIDWTSVIDGSVTLAFNGASAIGSDLFTAAGNDTYDVGKHDIQVDALMAILEENQDGEVLAKPTIYVDSGQKGYIQVGKDFSIKSVDDAGNTVDQFFSTGVILDVTPTIIYDNLGNRAINLNIKVERSSAIPGAVSTEITKSKATSSLTIYNGEETTIGGLYDKDETVTRGGVPILKDLPWWFLGLRYLFGYNNTTYQEKELVIIMQAEVIDSVIEREANQ